MLASRLAAVLAYRGEVHPAWEAIQSTQRCYIGPFAVEQVCAVSKTNLREVFVKSAQI